MVIDKTKLIQDIEVMRKKLISIEKELNKYEGFKYFPTKGDEYYFYTQTGAICSNIETNNKLKINLFKTEKEAREAYNKEVALEKIKRRLLELQGEWIPNWKDGDELKTNICYYHYSKVFEVEAVYFSQSFSIIPYMKSEEIANAIINEFHSELRLILNIA